MFRDPKRLIATLIAGVAGLIVLIDFAGPIPGVAPLAFLLVSWAATLTALALLIGLVSVAASHVRRVTRRDAGWGYSVVLLAAMLAVIVIGIIGDGFTILPQSLAEEPIRRFFRYVYEPVASSLLALLVFFSLSAALRSLQRRNIEAVVLLVVAVVVLVIQLPPVVALPYVGTMAQWAQDYLAFAGARGLVLGAAIGTLVVSVRVLIGFDQPYLDR